MAKSFFLQKYPQSQGREQESPRGEAQGALGGGDAVGQDSP